MTDTPYPWHPAGAWSGGTVSAVALSPQFVADGVALAATAAGLFRSTDGGRSWRLSGDGMDDPVVFALACAPVDHGWIALASTGTGRLYRSDDGGEHWQQVDAWAGLGVITALALSPEYASDRTIFAATVEGMFRSQDDGASWESSTFGLLDTEILCIAAAPDFAQSETLWIGSALGGLYRSRNGARSWRDSGMGLPDSAVQCLLVSPGYWQDRTLWVGMEEGGLYRSTDGGGQWEAAAAHLADVSINSLLAVGDEGRTLLAGTDAGLYRSTDGGVSWAEVKSAPFVALALTAAGDTVLAATFAEGVYRSTDGGLSWATANEGLVAHAPPLVQQSESGVLVALDLDGTLAASTDGGQTWSVAEPDGIGAFALTKGGEVWAAMEGSLLTAHVDEFAQGWAEQPAPVDEPHILALSPDFVDDGTLLVGDGSGTLHLSEDDAETWEALNAPQPGAALLHAGFAPADMYADGEAIFAVTLAPAPGNNFTADVWIASLDSLEWENLIRFETEVSAVLVAVPDDPETGLLVFATQHRVIRLFNNAQDELAVEQFFFEPEVRLSAVAASPSYAQDSTLFAGSNRGVFRSTDGGASWAPLGAALAQPVVSLLPDGADGVRVVTLGGTVWQRG